MPAHKINPEARKEIITFRLPKYIIDEIDKFSTSHGLKRPYIVENAIVEHLKLKRPIRECKDTK